MNYPLTIFGVSLLALSTPALAQTVAKPKPAPATSAAQDRVRLHTLANVIGLEVDTQDNKELGEVEDLILDSADGSIDYVVIGQGGVMGVGEDKYLVPFESIEFVHQYVDGENVLHATTGLNEERLRKAPKLVKEQRIGSDTERAIRQAAGLTPDPTQPRARNSELVRARKVKGTQVLGATQGKIGELEDMVVDPLVGVVAYNVLATGGPLGLGEKHYSLPWELTRVRTDSNNQVVIGSELTKDRLAAAPEFDATDLKRMLGLPYVREVFEFFSVEPYFARATLASSTRTYQQEQRNDAK